MVETLSKDEITKYNEKINEDETAEIYKNLLLEYMGEKCTDEFKKDLEKIKKIEHLKSLIDIFEKE